MYINDYGLKPVSEKDYVILRERGDFLLTGSTEGRIIYNGCAVAWVKVVPGKTSMSWNYAIKSWKDAPNETYQRWVSKLEARVKEFNQHMLRNPDPTWPLKGGYVHR